MSRAGKNIAVRTTNRENEVVIRGKTTAQVGISTRRPLGDVGNKQTSQAAALKKTSSLTTKTSQVVVKKPTLAVEKKKPDLVTELSKTELNKLNIVDDTKKERLAADEAEFAKVDSSLDPQLVKVYIKDIYEYLRELERKHAIERNFLTGHQSTPKIRQILIGWLIEVHQSLKMVLETLHITVAIVDRYLQLRKEVGKQTLQLVGATALYVAAKYEEIYPPEVNDIVFLCDHAFNKKQIHQMERDILKTLKFDLSRPLSVHFVRRFNQAGHVSQENHSLGKYLLELCLFSYDMSHILPSIQASAACCLANAILEGASTPKEGWTKTLAHFSNYKYEDIHGTIVKIACLLGKVEQSPKHVIKEKYSIAKFDKVSLHPKLQGILVRKLIAQAPVISLK